MNYHFGIPLQQTSLSSNNLEKLKQNVAALTENGISADTPWNCNTRTTHGLFNIFEIDSFKWLIDDIKQAFDLYVKENNFSITDGSEFQLQGWLNFANKGDFQEIHDHLAYDDINPIVSGNIFINSDKDIKKTGCFVAVNPNRALFKACNYITKDNDNLSEAYHILPVPGKLILFPPFLDHYVSANNTDTTRITLSFNIVMV